MQSYSFTGDNKLEKNLNDFPVPMTMSSVKLNPSLNIYLVLSFFLLLPVLARPKMKGKWLILSSVYWLCFL